MIKKKEYQKIKTYKYHIDGHKIDFPFVLQEQPIAMLKAIPLKKVFRKMEEKRREKKREKREKRKEKREKRKKIK